MFNSAITTVLIVVSLKGSAQCVGWKPGRQKYIKAQLREFEIKKS